MSSAATITPADEFYGVEPPDVSGIVTEDDSPLVNFFCDKQQRLLVEPLYASWAGPPRLPDDVEEANAPRTFVAASNVGIFMTPEDPPLVPDILLSLDVELAADLWQRKNRTYFVWVMGKVPNVVIEVVANRDGEELSSLRRKYARIGIPYYVVWDPQGIHGEPKLRVFARSGDFYSLNSEEFSLSHHGLSLATWEGTYEGMHGVWLRWADLDGNLIPTGAERAEKERKRADAAQARAERLAEKLRSLGIDPAGDG